MATELEELKQELVEMDAIIAKTMHDRYDKWLIYKEKLDEHTRAVKEGNDISSTPDSG